MNTGRFRRITPPSVEAPAPRIVKTVAKPSTKRSAEEITRLRTATAADGSRATPLTYERYPGIRGRQHGDVNDTAPATNASAMAPTAIPP